MLTKNWVFVSVAAVFVALSAGNVNAAGEKDSPAKSTKSVPGNVAGNYLSGEFARSKGNMEDAIRYAQRVHRQQPENMTIAVQLEGMLLLQGKVEDALAVAKEIHEASKKLPAKDPAKDPLADLLLTLDAMKNDKPDAAANQLNAALEAGSTQLWVPLARGWVNIAQGKMDKPLAVSGGTTDAGRAAPLINYHLALINAQGGFKEQAAKNFKEAVPDAKNPSLRVMRQLIAFSDKNNSPKILAPVIKTFRDANPGIKDDEDITAITTPKDGLAELLYSMGGLMYAAGGLNDAAIYLQLALYIKPGLTEASIALGDSYSELQYYALASDAYAQVPATNKYYSKGQLRIALNEERAGKEKEAIARLDNLAAQDTASPDALIAKGDVLRMHERFAEATDAYTQALKRIAKPQANHWSIYFARGSSFERQGKWPEAERDLQQALDLKPDQPDVLNYLGYGWLEHGEHITQARDMIAKAVKLRPNDPQIVDSMGWALYLHGDYKQATAYLEKAIELLPADPTVNDHLGDAYWRMGRKNEARFQWERSLTFAPEPKLADTIRKKLKDGLPPTATLAETAPAAGKTATP